jgi:type IV secretion system protein VirB4
MIHQKRSLQDAGRSQQEELEEGRDRITSGIETLGHHHMTVAVYALDDDVLGKASAEIRTIAQETGTTMITEAFAGPGHYFAQWPGNAAYRSRVGLVTNKSFASQASLHRTPTGFQGAELPWGTPITVFPTPERSAVHFSFHPQGKLASESEPPAGHSLIFGPTGGGKSVLIALLAAQARRVNTRVFAFDYRRGLEWQIRALGGSYTTISPDSPTGLNPLYAETDPTGQAWLSDWLAALLRREDRPYAPIQTQALHHSVVQNAEAPSALRNWAEFGSLFRSLDDGGDLEQRVREWAPGGRYGWVFGQNATDSFALDKAVMGFDLTAVLDSDQEKERTAILGYVFQRLERKLQDRQPTLIVIDEAWKALATTYFAEKLQNWLVTARKLNAVVLLVTQFPSQLKSSKVGESMLQAVQSQILLCNDRAKPSNYDILNLNERELATVLSAPVGKRLALVRNEAGAVVVDFDLSELGGCLTLLGGGGTVRNAIGGMENDPEAWRKLL